MAYTAYALRGFFYPEPGVAGCPNYKQCPACPLCENYSTAVVECQYCESRKSPPQICKCEPERKSNVRRYVDLVKRPMYVDPNIDMEFGKIDTTDVSAVEDWDKIADSVAAYSRGDISAEEAYDTALELRG